MNRPARMILAAALPLGLAAVFIISSRKPGSPRGPNLNQPEVRARARVHAGGGPPANPATREPEAEEPIASGPTAVAGAPHPSAPALTSPVADTLESSTLPAQTVLENMRTDIRQFGAAFGENPVGTNPEITTALQGDNPKHINFLKPDGNRVNSKGELVDVFGTPYFFHQISGHEMEIRSAGPDRIMYTADDLVIR